MINLHIKKLAILLIIGAIFMASPLALAATGLHDPDIILIITDDQHFKTLKYLPSVKENLPVSYTRAFVSNPMCCPSRTAILTGLYSHDNGIWNNTDPNGGSAAFQRWTEAGGISIAEALHTDGYRTGLYGKFLNGWDPNWIPPGWDEFYADALGDPATGLAAPYYDYVLSGKNDAGLVHEIHGEQPTDYSTDVLTNHVTDFISTSSVDMPLFVWYATNAPHASGKDVPAIPAPQDVDADVSPLMKVGPAYNEDDVSDKPAWVRRLNKQDDSFIQDWMTQAARSLLSVNRSVDSILAAQEVRDPGLTNTVILFMSDNGFQNGAHRWFSKGVPYEDAIHIPMRAYYPPGMGGASTDALVTNLDIAPTFADIASIDFPTIDGISLLSGQTRNYFVIEGGTGSKDRIFCGVRTNDAKFVKYNTGEKEFYRFNNDPYELRNHPNAAAAVKLRDISNSECSYSAIPGW